MNKGCCETIAGIPQVCENNVGGIRRAWGVCFSSTDRPTVTDGVITKIEGGSSWVEYEFRKQTGSFTSTITKDATAGTSFIQTEIIFQFSKQETAKRIEINSLAISDTAWIIQDSNGRFWYFGFDNGVELTTGAGETGTAYGDFNGYNITLTDIAFQMPYEVSEAAMAGLLD